MATKVEKTGKRDNSEANRMARLLRTQKKQPNNKQIDAALKGSRMRRKTPNNQVWSASSRKMAQLFKSITGRFDPNILSSNSDVAHKAMAKVGPGTLSYKPLEMPSRPFSLAQRVKDKYGNYVWS